MRRSSKVGWKEGHMNGRLFFISIPTIAKSFYNMVQVINIGWITLISGVF